MLGLIIKSSMSTRSKYRSTTRLNSSLYDDSICAIWQFVNCLRSPALCFEWTGDDLSESEVFDGKLTAGQDTQPFRSLTIEQFYPGGGDSNGRETHWVN